MPSARRRERGNRTPYGFVLISLRFWVVGSTVALFPLHTAQCEDLGTIGLPGNRPST